MSTPTLKLPTQGSTNSSNENFVTYKVYDAPAVEGS